MIKEEEKEGREKEKEGRLGITKEKRRGEKNVMNIDIMKKGKM